MSRRTSFFSSENASPSKSAYESLLDVYGEEIEGNIVII